jgi:hypothetical protein
MSLLNGCVCVGPLVSWSCRYSMGQGGVEGQGQVVEWRPEADLMGWADKGAATEAAEATGLCVCVCACVCVCTRVCVRVCLYVWGSLGDHGVVVSPLLEALRALEVPQTAGGSVVTHTPSTLGPCSRVQPRGRPRLPSSCRPFCRTLTLTSSTGRCVCRCRPTFACIHLYVLHCVDWVGCVACAACSSSATSPHKPLNTTT